MTKTIHTIDASGKTLGRLSTEVATILMGKQTPAFRRHIAPEEKVLIVNAAKIRLTEKKRSEKTYTRSSGYPGGLKTQTLDEMIIKKGYVEAIRHAVRGMLPANRLRAKMLLQLTVNE